MQRQGEMIFSKTLGKGAIARTGDDSEVAAAGAGGFGGEAGVFSDGSDFAMSLGDDRQVEEVAQLFHEAISFGESPEEGGDLILSEGVNAVGRDVGNGAEEVSNPGVFSVQAVTKGGHEGNGSGGSAGPEGVELEFTRKLKACFDDRRRCAQTLDGERAVEEVLKGGFDRFESVGEEAAKSACGDVGAAAAAVLEISMGLEGQFKALGNLEFRGEGGDQGDRGGGGGTKAELLSSRRVEFAEIEGEGRGLNHFA